MDTGQGSEEALAPRAVLVGADHSPARAGSRGSANECFHCATSLDASRPARAHSARLLGGRQVRHRKPREHR